MADTKFDGGFLEMFNPVKEFEVVEGFSVKARALHLEDYVAIQTEYPDADRNLRLPTDSIVDELAMFCFVIWLAIREDTRAKIERDGKQIEVEIEREDMQKMVNNRTMLAWREVWDWITDIDEDDAGEAQESETDSKN